MVLGAARLELDTPPVLEGERINAFLDSGVDQGNLRIYVDARAVDGQAVFFFPCVPAAQYRMHISASRTWFWLPGSYVETEGARITVVADEETVYQGRIPDLAGIHGTVTGSWQQMNMYPPMLRLFDGDSTWIATGDGADDGTYQLWALAPLRGRLLITIEDHSRWHGGNSFDTATEFDLHPGDDTEVNIVESGIAGQLGVQCHVLDLWCDQAL